MEKRTAVIVANAALGDSDKDTTFSHSSLCMNGNGKIIAYLSGLSLEQLAGAAQDDFLNGKPNPFDLEFSPPCRPPSLVPAGISQLFKKLKEMDIAAVEIVNGGVRQDELIEIFRGAGFGIKLQATQSCAPPESGATMVLGLYFEN